jgi:hypothetical protein
MNVRFTRAAAFALAVTFAVYTHAAPKHELSLAAGVDSAYDDNVFNGRGPDWVNRITPHGSWRMVDPRIQVGAAYDFAYWTYAFGKASNSLNHRATLTIEGKPTRRLTLRATDEFVRAQDPGFLIRAAVVAPQIGIFDNVAEALAGFAFTRRFYGDVDYTWHHTQFDPYSAEQQAAGMAPLFDGDEHDIQAVGAYRVFRTDDVRFGGRAQVFTAGPQATSSWRWNQAATYSPSVGWRHQFLPELEWTADGGPLIYQRLAGAAHIPGSPDSGVTWRLATRLRWYTPTWRGALSYTHDLLGATGIGSAAWADYAYAQIGYHFGERLDAHAGGGYFRNGVAVSQPFSYDGFTVDALIDWRVIANLRLGAYYTLRWQRTGPGAIPPGAAAAQFPDVTRDIVGIRLLAVIGADARPPRREAKEVKE